MKFVSSCVIGLSAVTLLAVGSEAKRKGTATKRTTTKHDDRLGRTTRHLSSKKNSKKDSKKGGGGKGGGCFPAGAKVDVFLEDDTYVETNIEDLKTGDEVKCVDETTNQAGKCEVFFHWHPSFLIPDGDIYLEVKHEDGEITLSEDHLLYIAPTATTNGDIFPALPPLTDKNFITAANIKKDDLVIVENDSDQMVATKVKSVETVKKDTYYAPLVKGGRFFVDNTLASSYVTFPDSGDAVNGEDTAHFVLNAMYGGFLHNALKTGALSTEEMWNKTRDDPDYIAWEVADGGYWEYAFRSTGWTWWAMLKAENQSKTLIGDEAIIFEESVRDLIASQGSITDAEMAGLYYDAVGMIEI